MRLQYNPVINLDGHRLKVVPEDIDGNGVTGNVERITMRGEQGVTNITQASELGETIRELNRDEIEEHTGMSGIDMKSRLHYVEIGSILAMDALVALRVLPPRCLAFTRQKKRLSVSLNGAGRGEMVDLVGRKHDLDKAKSNMGSSNQAGGLAKGFFGL